MLHLQLRACHNMKILMTLRSGSSSNNSWWTFSESPAIDSTWSSSIKSWFSSFVTVLFSLNLVDKLGFDIYSSKVVFNYVSLHWKYILHFYRNNLLLWCSLCEVLHTIGTVHSRVTPIKTPSTPDGHQSLSSHSHSPPPSQVTNTSYKLFSCENVLRISTY